MSRQHPHPQRAPVLLLGLALASGAAQANLLANGSFEAGTFTPNLPGVQQIGLVASPITGWTTFVGDVFWVSNSNPYGITASDGNLSMNLYDPTRPLVRVGSVQQSVASSIGTRYEVSFDIGSSSNYLRPVGVRVQAAGQAADFYSPPTGGAMDWQRFTWAFTANDTTTVVAFVGLFGDGYIGLDHAVLHATPVPEPGRWALLSAGLGVVLLRRRFFNLNA